NPGFTVLPMHIIAEQRLVQLVHVRVVRKHNVRGEIERESVQLKRRAPASDCFILLREQRIATEVIRGTQGSWTRANDNDGRLLRNRVRGTRGLRGLRDIIV